MLEVFFESWSQKSCNVMNFFFIGRKNFYYEILIYRPTRKSVYPQSRRMVKFIFREFTNFIHFFPFLSTREKAFLPRRVLNIGFLKSGWIRKSCSLTHCCTSEDDEMEELGLKISVSGITLNCGTAGGIEVTSEFIFSGSSSQTTAEVHKHDTPCQ